MFLLREVDGHSVKSIAAQKRCAGDDGELCKGGRRKIPFSVAKGRRSALVNENEEAAI